MTALFVEVCDIFGLRKVDDGSTRLLTRSSAGQWTLSVKNVRMLSVH